MYFFLVVVGGILFKVYIVGETVKVVRRFSLPDISKRELAKNPGVFRFPRVSCAAASADEADLDPSVGGEPSLPSVTFSFLFHQIPHGCFRYMDATNLWDTIEEQSR